MTNGGSRLEVAYLWRQLLLDYRLLGKGQRVTLGTASRVTFIAPADVAVRGSWPGRASFLVPLPSGGYRLRLWPGMSGQLRRGGETADVAGLLLAPGAPRVLRKPALYRDVVLATSDGGEILLDATNQLRLRLAFVDPPEVVGARRRQDPLLFRTGFWTSSLILSSLLLLLFFGDRVPSERTLAISPERYARLLASPPERPVAKLRAERAQADAEEKKRKEREAAESRRMKEAEGKLGRADATRKETVLPKGREDLLREKVAKKGVLAVLGSSRSAGSGLGKLLTRNSSLDLDQALNGLEGAKLAAGHGSGGLGVAGTGLGGGGTSFGRIQGSGNLDVGAGRGRGRKGPNLGAGKEKEVQVAMETGNPDAEGGLSKDQINRVVRSHAAAVKYCYEKELQRHPHLNGRVDLSWVIHTNGTADRARVVKSTLDNRDVEGCIERQVRNWQFPKSTAETIVATFPFLFKGGN